MKIGKSVKLGFIAFSVIALFSLCNAGLCQMQQSSCCCGSEQHSGCSFQDKSDNPVISFFRIDLPKADFSSSFIQLNIADIPQVFSDYCNIIIRNDEFIGFKKNHPPNAPPSA